TWTVFLLARQGFMIDAVPWGMRGRALSTLGGTHRIGMFLGPVLAAPLIAAHGARSAFLFAAAMSGLALLLVLRVPDLGGAARAEARADPASMRQVLHAHRRALLTLGVGALGISALRGVRLTIIPLWADHLGLSPANVALIVGLGALLEILVFYPAGALMDRAGRVWVAVPTALLLGIGLLLIPSTGSLRALLLASLVMALGNGLGSGIVMTLGADTAPRVHRAKYLGGWRLVADLGATGGPLLVSGVTLVAGLATASVVVGAGGVLVAGWLAQWVGALDRARRGPGRPVDERMRE
ncbi:MAG: MFS transporter, partial [Nostocoides sp.]